MKQQRPVETKPLLPGSSREWLLRHSSAHRILACRPGDLSTTTPPPAVIEAAEG